MGIVLANGKSVNEGDRFGKWTVEKAYRDEFRKPMADVRCDCGRVATRRIGLLFAGGSKGCNHCHKETHRRTKTPEYRAWRSMLCRCYRQKDISYPNYGGRGVTVCERWRKSFENFLSDMGERPSPKHSLDRKDSTGNYQPSNCRWGTLKDQNQNRRSNVQLTYAGSTHCIAEWARITGITKHALEQRVSRGWTTERALTQPLKEKIFAGRITQQRS